MNKPLLSFLVFIALTFVTVCDRGRERTNVVTGDGLPEVRVTFHHVDLDLADYQFLISRWYIEEPIESPLDERTREGDDYPTRLFLVFRTATGQDRRMEIIWGNKAQSWGLQIYRRVSPLCGRRQQREHSAMAKRGVRPTRGLSPHLARWGARSSH